MGGVRFVDDEVVNPYDPDGRRQRVKRAIREHTLDAIAQAGHLAKAEGRRDATEARMEAGRRYLATYLAASGKGASAVDYSAEKVDVSFRYDGTPESQARALRRMAEIHDHIGWRLKRILDKTIIEEVPVMIQVRSHKKGATLGFYADLRRALDGVADIFGTAVGREVHRILVSRETIA